MDGQNPCRFFFVVQARKRVGATTFPHGFKGGLLAQPRRALRLAQVIAVAALGGAQGYLVSVCCARGELDFLGNMWCNSLIGSCGSWGAD